MKTSNIFDQGGSLVAMDALNKYSHGGRSVAKTTLINLTSQNRIARIPCCMSKLVCCFFVHFQRVNL